MNKRLTTVFAAFLFLSAPVYAQTLPQFAFPLDCTLGKDCWTINYVDTDPAPESAVDFTCASKTYEGHEGTDFALRTRLEMQNGVNVLAAKDGKILRMRDGEDDLPKTEEEYAAIRAKDRDCGNGIIIDHGDGLVTYYCHLKQNSILVKPGDAVKEGQKIAQIGQSGYSEFPHLHFNIIWEGGYIDPFTGVLREEGCGKFKDNLWKDDIAYAPYAVFDGGFRGELPDFAAIQAGEPEIKSLKAQSLQAFVYWAGFYHAREGDEITLTIHDPEGKIYAQRTDILKENRKRPSYYYTGRKLNGKTLKPGIYKGSITYKKDGREPETFTHQVVVE